MDKKNLLIFCVTAIICVGIVSGTLLFINNDYSQSNSVNDTVNITLNDTKDTNNATIIAKKTTETTKKNTDPDYDTERDESHKYATEDNPITVQQDDGVYTYYGPGHYDYYAGDNHMSGEYYRERNSK